MALTTHEDSMALEINGVVVATAKMRTNGWWLVTAWPRYFTRNQAITALTITELLETGYGKDHPVIVALREELR